MSFLGMRGNDDWVADQRPKNWREMILRLYPNGNAPLTAIQSMGRSEPVDDPEFNWWTKALPEQRGAITDLYTDVGLSSAYTEGNGAAGDTLYAKVAAATAAHFRAGHTALLRDASQLEADVVAKVTAVVANGANSYIACKLLEADDNGSSHGFDVIKVNGNLNPEGGVTPDSIAYDPTKYYNYTQIFRTPLSITRTARKTRLRTGDQYKEAKREALELMSIEMEWATLTGIAYEGIGDNGKPERTSQGLIPFIRANASSNISDYTTDEDFDDTTWLNGGDDWLLKMLEQLTRYTDGKSPDYVMLAGSGALMALERLARANGQMNLTPGQTLGYGIKVVNWVTSFGTFPIKLHPLFSYEASMRYAMVIYKPRNLVTRIIDDIQFLGNNGKNYGYTASGKRVDGIEEEFLAELGFEYHHPQTAMLLYGFNNDNPA
jgi:hypothetical protein